MREYKTIHVLERIDVNKLSNKTKECDLCHYLHFTGKKFNYEPYLCNGCHNLM